MKEFLTIESLRRKFNEFNEKYFDGELPMTSFGYSNTRKRLGQFIHREYKITITRYYENTITEHDVEEILIHEMVHAWQKYVNHCDHHGYYFKRKASEINRKSNGYFHIARCTNLENGGDYSSHRNTNVVYMLVCRKGDGKVYMGRVADKRDFESWLGEYYNSIECYQTSGEEFNKFVKSRRQFHYTTLSESEYERYANHFERKITFNNEYRRAV